MTAAIALAWCERLKTKPAVNIRSYRLGPATILHLPSEVFAGFRLFAHIERPDDFVAVAAYGDFSMGGICTEAVFVETGYEPTQSLVGPPTEVLLKAPIREVLE